MVVGVYLIAVLFGVTPYLRGPDEWRWGDAGRHFDWRILPLLFLLLGVVGIALWTESHRPRFRSRRAEGGFLALLVALSLAEQVAVLVLEPDGPLAQIFQRTVSPMSNGYYMAALNIGQDAADLSGFLRTYPSHMPNFVSQHPRTHPPGLVVSHWLVIRAVQHLPALGRPLETWTRRHQCPTIVGEGRVASDLAGALVAGVLIMFVGALTVVPVYLLGRRIGGEDWARRAAILYLLVPAAAMFVPTPDQIYPFVAASSLLAFQIGLERELPAYTFLSGLLISVGSFFSFSCGVIVLFLALYALLRPGRPPLRSVNRWFSMAAWFAAGVAAVWLIYYLLSEVSVLEVLTVARTQHQALTASHRSYLTWLGFNLYDFFAFLGWPLAFLVVKGAVVRKRSVGRAMVWALILTLFLLDLSGTTRAEVARLWLFLMPLAALVAAGVLAQNWGDWRSDTRDVWRWRTIGALQAALVLVLAFSWEVTVFVPHPVPAVPRRFESSPIARPVSAVFDNQIELIGYDLAPSAIRSGETLDLTLHWRALVEPQQSHKVFVHLLDSDGALRTQADGVPVAWALPTTCWVRGEIITDPYTLTLPPDAPPGDYTLAVGLYLEATMERLPVDNGDRVRLGPVSVPSSP